MQWNGTPQWINYQIVADIWQEDDGLWYTTIFNEVVIDGSIYYDFHSADFEPEATKNGLLKRIYDEFVFS